MTFKVKTVECFEAPDGSLYRTEAEAATAVLQTSITTLAGYNADQLKAAVANPGEAPADLLDSIAALSDFFLFARPQPTPAPDPAAA